MILLYIMMSIKISDRNYLIHPVYDLYAASDDGSIINVENKIPSKGDKSCNGYMKCLVRKNSQMLRIYYVHRLIWECFNGTILRGKVIDHINDIKDDNRLSNLQLLSRKVNNKKQQKIVIIRLWLIIISIKNSLKPSIVVPMRQHTMVVCMLFNKILVLMQG